MQGDAAERVTHLSDEEHRALKDATDTRHELVGGVADAMIGGSLGHARVFGNLDFARRRRLGHPCEAFSEALKRRIADDVGDAAVMIARDPWDAATHWSERPGSIIAERPAPGSQRVDRTEKLTAYRAPSSLEAAAVVSQAAPRTARCGRAADWKLRILEASDTLDVPLPLPLPPLSFGVEEIFEAVDFP